MWPGLYQMLLGRLQPHFCVLSQYMATADIFSFHSFQTRICIHSKNSIWSNGEYYVGSCQRIRKQEEDLRGPVTIRLEIGNIS